MASAPCAVAHDLFYLDPTKVDAVAGVGLANKSFTPRLFFENDALWDSALKLKRLIEGAAVEDQLYFDAMGLVLMHELIRLDRGAPVRDKTYMRGGLAPHQQRVVTAYIEEHLREPISIATLADLVDLSPFTSAVLSRSHLVSRRTGITPDAASSAPKRCLQSRRSPSLKSDLQSALARRARSVRHFERRRVLLLAATG